MGKTRLLFVRHGRQDSVLCNADVPLSEEGRAQAELLSERLSGDSFDLIVTSTLLRAIETGDIINRKLGLPVEHYEALGEIDWGDLTGLSNAAMRERYGAFLTERKKRTSDLPFPGGESGEECFARSFPVIKELCSRGLSSVLIVSHGGTIRSMIPGLLGLPFSSKLAYAATMENTALTEFLFDSESGMFTLERLNDYSHLSGHTELMRKSWKL